MASVSLAGTAAAIPGVGEIAAAVEAIGAIFNEIAGFIKKADPGAFNQLNLAFENMQASIGAILEPLVGILIPLLDGLNIIFTALADALKQVWDALQPLIKPIIDWFMALAKQLGVIIRVIGAILAPIIKFISVIVGAVVEVFNMITKFFSGLLGLGGEAKKTTAAQGATTLSPDALSKALQEASMGGSAQRNYQEEIADNTKSIDRKTKEPKDAPVQGAPAGNVPVVVGNGNGGGGGDFGPQVKKRPAMGFGARQPGGAAKDEPANPWNIFDKRNWSSIVGGEGGL